MKSTSSFTFFLLGFLTYDTFAQETSSSSTLHIPGPMQQIISSTTQLSGTRTPDSTSSQSTLSIPRPMEQSLTTTVSSDMTSTMTDSTTTDMSSTANSDSTSTATTYTRSGGVGNDATRTGVSQSQDTNAAEAIIGGMGMEQMVMMGLGVGAAWVI